MIQNEVWFRSALLVESGGSFSSIHWKDLLKGLEALGFQVIRQKGSHLTLERKIDGKTQNTGMVQGPISLNVFTTIARTLGWDKNELENWIRYRKGPVSETQSPQVPTKFVDDLKIEGIVESAARGFLDTKQLWAATLLLQIELGNPAKRDARKMAVQGISLTKEDHEFIQAVLDEVKGMLGSRVASILHEGWIREWKDRCSIRSA